MSYTKFSVARVLAKVTAKDFELSTLVTSLGSDPARKRRRREFALISDELVLSVDPVVVGFSSTD